jgi:hypothetical protein
VSDFIKATDDSYTHKQLVDCEWDILSVSDIFICKLESGMGDESYYSLFLGNLGYDRMGFFYENDRM